MKYSEIPILMYHEISEVNTPWCVSPSEFAKQMKFLVKNSYQTITLSELKSGIESDQETDQKLVVITFDDARKGVYEHAYPLLRQYGFKAIVYVVPSWIENKTIPETEKYSEFLTWTELKEWSADNFEIGSHTFSHKNLTALDENSLAQELELAEQTIFNNLNVKAKHFSYPYGLYSQDVVQQAAQRYETSVSLNRGFNRSGQKYARQWILRETSLEQFAKLLQIPTLSLCMITKNEEQFLEQCLNSVQELVDEIIIVDTGSTDKTKAIAAKFTDKIFDFKWGDDFSKARNESLKQATKDWILVLDADEIMDARDHSLVKEAINRWEVDGFRILTRNYTNDSSLCGWQAATSSDQFARVFTGWVHSLKVRLFQRKDQIIFKGRIHEMVDDLIIQDRGKIAVLPVNVHHYGYYGREEKNVSKLNYYLQLSQKKTQEEPTNAKAYYELGVLYREAGNLALAESAFQESVGLDQHPTPLTNLAIVQQKQGKYQEAIHNYMKVLEQRETHPDAYFGLGFCYFKKGLLEKSKDNFELAIKNKPAYLDAYVNLGAVYEKLNRFNEAVLCYKKALLINPKHARAYYNLGVAHEKMMNLESALNCYQQALALDYDKKEWLKTRISEIKEFITKHG